MWKPKVGRHVTLYRLVGSKIKPQSATITNVDSATQLDLKIDDEDATPTAVANATKWTGPGTTRSGKWRPTA